MLTTSALLNVDLKSISPISSYSFGLAIYQREEVSPMEIFCECFNKDKGDFDGKTGKAIAAILIQIPSWDKADKRKTMGPYGKQTVYIRKKK